MGLFGKSQQPDPKVMVNEWSHKIRKEGYSIERSIKAIQREVDKTKKMLKDSAKKGDKSSCRILAKEIVKANKHISKMYASKAHLNSVGLQMKHQLATLRVAGALDKSTNVMQSMQNLVKVPEMMATMRDMAKEMMKAGIIEEMIDDTMDVLDDEDLDEEADEEVDKVLYELTAGELGKAPEAVDDSLPMPEPEGAVAGPSRTAVPLEEDDDMDDMKARLEALRS